MMDSQKNEGTLKELIEQSSDINATNKQDMESLKNEKRKFSKKISGLNAIACNNINQKNFNLINAINDSQSEIKALCLTDSLKEMLAAQLLSVHNLQQSSMAMANASDDLVQKQYFTNAAIKLSCCFAQQASLLAKLQGVGAQKIVVEHVEVHGQAIVGNVNRGNPN